MNKLLIRLTKTPINTENMTWLNSHNIQNSPSVKMRKKKSRLNKYSDFSRLHRGRRHRLNQGISSSEWSVSAHMRTISKGSLNTAHNREETALVLGTIHSPTPHALALVGRFLCSREILPLILLWVSKAFMHNKWSWPEQHEISNECPFSSQLKSSKTK